MSDPHAGPIIEMLQEKNRWIAVIGGYEVSGATQDEVQSKAVAMVMNDPLIAMFIQAARVDAAAEMRESCAMATEDLGDQLDGQSLGKRIRQEPLPPAEQSFLREKIERAIQDTFAACMVDGQVPTYKSILAEAAKERT